MPHTLVLPEAKQADVARLLREELTARGARLDEQTASRTLFEDLPAGGGFSRGGYVGTYQPLGEKGVEVVVETYATVPRKVFWGVLVVEVVLVPLLFVTSPPSAAFFAASLLLWGVLVLAAVIYYLTLRQSRALEADLAGSFLGKLRAAGLAVLDDEQQLERRIRDKLEGEVKEREVAARPPPPKAARPATQAAGGKRGLLGKRKP